VRRFARLFDALDATTRTGEKVSAMADYFRAAPPADAAWAVHFLSGGRPKRLVPVRRLAVWAMEAADTPAWLFEECYHTVGDLAETISLLLPPPDRASDLPLHLWVGDRLLPMNGEAEDVQRRIVTDAWRELDGTERFLWTKLITGGFRVGVSRNLVVRALSAASGVDEATTAHRLMGSWEPTEDAFRRLVAERTDDADISRPYPFFLAYPLESDPVALGAPAEWLAEWKWDGIRSQVIRRAGATFIWSRGEALVTDRFPEIAEAAALLPDGVVIDGEIMGWKAGVPLPFADLQRRIGRTKLGPKILADVPVALIAYDLLELGGEDIRELPLATRRARLMDLLGGRGTKAVLLPSPAIEAGTWDDVRAARDRARHVDAEGLMLKRLDSAYGVGRRRGAWWKWKVDPFSVDAVMLYAQPGHGRRATLHTDYTFAVWRGDELIPFAKAYSGLTDTEIRRLDRWIRNNTIEKFGPVRSVRAEQVFEVAFEGIQRSSRHKSGIAVRFPRIARWRTDKRPEEADSIEALQALLGDRATSPKEA
jgi:DNA ligase-1